MWNATKLAEQRARKRWRDRGRRAVRWLSQTMTESGSLVFCSHGGGTLARSWSCDLGASEECSKTQSDT